MPNHVDNHMIITGPKADLDEFLAVSTQGYEIKPGDRAAASARSLSLMEPEVVRVGEFSFGALTGVPDDYAHNWYEVALSTWGTKWDCYDLAVLVQDNRIMVDFNTAWGPPSEYYKALAERFPRLEVTVTFTDEAYNFVGWAMAKHGHYEEDSLMPQDLECYVPYPEQKDGESDLHFEDRVNEYEITWGDRHEAMLDELRRMAEEALNAMPFQVAG
jgi:hypothetical protein